MRGVSRLWQLAPGVVRRTFIASIWTRVNYGAAWQRERAHEVAREADRPDMIDTLGGAIASADFDAYRHALDTLPAQHVPTLLLSCGHDRVVPCRQQQDLLDRIPHVSHHHLADGTHLPMWQHPDTVAGLLVQHWKGGGE